MKKKFIFFLIFITGLFFYPNIVKGSESTDDTNIVGNGEYAITRYNIDMVVNENNTFDIVEDITSHFNVGKHGIFRKIPLKNEVKRLDGTTSKNNARVTDVTVNNDFVTYRQNEKYIIQIGSKDFVLKGYQSYKIKYNYNIGKDTGKGYDELYFNLIGSEWDTTISNIMFTITMPKEFDKSKIGFSSGYSGSTDSSKVTYNVDGNLISGKYNGILKAGEAITIRLELPEGYFIGASNIENESIILFMIPIVLAFLSFLNWKFHCKDSKIIETVEFYPPSKLNSLELGYLYNGGKAYGEDVISLLIYLASKGYIKIVEINKEGSELSDKNFKIIKLKEYDGENIYEQIFFEGLFTKKEMISNGFSLFKRTDPIIEVIDEFDEVTSEDLNDNFYITSDEILRKINNKEDKNHLYEKIEISRVVVILLMIIISYATITVTPMLIVNDVDVVTLSLSLFLSGFSFFMILLGLFLPPLKTSKKKNDSVYIIRVFIVIFSTLLGGIPWVNMYLPYLLDNRICLFGYIIGIICIIIMCLCLRFSSKPTDYGIKILGKIRGFKKFLETAEKEQLESLVKEEPEYFYNILPYTYVLGISDKWMEKFETISPEAPNWYDGSSTFEFSAFGDFIDSAMSSTTDYSSSSSSDSGGGSSSSGSGGGGGGSW